MLLLGVVVGGMLSAFVAFVLGVLLDSGGTLTRRGIVAEWLTGVLFLVAAGCCGVAFWLLITS